MVRPIMWTNVAIQFWTSKSLTIGCFQLPDPYCSKQINIGSTNEVNTWWLLDVMLRVAGDRTSCSLVGVRCTMSFLGSCCLSQCQEFWLVSFFSCGNKSKVITAIKTFTLGIWNPNFLKAIAIVPTIWKPDHSKWWQFVWISDSIRNPDHLQHNLFLNIWNLD